MNQSPEINELAMALSKAQGEKKFVEEGRF